VHWTVDTNRRVSAPRSEETRKGGNCGCIARRFGLFLAKFVLFMHNCHFPASDQNSDISIRFSDPSFLKEVNYLAIRRRFHPMTFTFDHNTVRMCVYASQWHCKNCTSSMALSHSGGAKGILIWNRLGVDRERDKDVQYSGAICWISIKCKSLQKPLI